ncbi:glyoxalase [Nocardioides ginsengisoli]|uniref:Glyoxalase n=1 Tax=Nocardioides ginsengisoli TaxID=363868 RepID=A0ABW3W5D5_9ACTN
MSNINTLVLEVADPAAARTFYTEAFGPDLPLDFRAGSTPSEGFRGFHVSFVMAQPADVDALAESALAAGATMIKPVSKSFWGYGGVLRAPDGAIWKVASSSKKNTGPVSRSFESIALLIGAADVAASKQFYVDRGFGVGKSFGKKYVEFTAGTGRVTLALLSRKALAKDAGVPMEGSGSHRLTIVGGATAATDPDGFPWEPEGQRQSSETTSSSAESISSSSD